MSYAERPIDAPAFDILPEERELLEAVASSAGHDANGDSSIRSRFARVVWSRLIEPGDVAAGALIHHWGPTNALVRVISQDPESCNEWSLESLLLADDEARNVISQRQFRAALKRWLPRLDRGAVLEDLRAAHKAKLKLLIPIDHEWPTPLQDLGHHAPILLWGSGNMSALQQHSLAVVGARACSSDGANTTAELVADACTVNVAIVSGAAYGVDAVAHKTALQLSGSTVAFLAGGADRPYPRSNAGLLQEIAQHGIVCSEMPPGAAPTRWRFLQRNRLIAGLANATLVTEAGVRSGSLNTAGHASQLGRGLGAVPGRPGDPNAAGCLRLIKDYDALMVVGRDDVLQLLGVEESQDACLDEEENERELSLHRRIIDALPLRGARSLDEIAAAAGIAPETARNTVAELELLERVERRGENSDGNPVWGLRKAERAM